MVGIRLAPNGVSEVLAVLGSFGIDAFDCGGGFHMVDVFAFHDAADARYKRCVNEYVEGAGALFQDRVCAAANDNAASLICELCDCVGLGQPQIVKLAGFYTDALIVLHVEVVQHSFANFLLVFADVGGSEACLLRGELDKRYVENGDAELFP